MKKHQQDKLRIEDDPDEELYIEEEPATLQDNIRRYLIITSVALGIVFVGYIGLNSYLNSQAEKQREAATELSRIRPYYESGDYQVALDGDPSKSIRGASIIGLAQIAGEYADTEAGKLAALYAGQASRMIGDYTQAEKYFDMAGSAEATMTRIGAQAGLAACKAKSEQFSEAAGLYEQASTLAKDTGNDEHYQLYAAMLYERAGETGEALRMYKGIISSNEFSEFAGEAKSGLVRLGASID